MEVPLQPVKRYPPHNSGQAASSVVSLRYFSLGWCYEAPETRRCDQSETRVRLYRSPFLFGFLVARHGVPGSSTLSVPMVPEIIKMKARGFICVNSHPGAAAR